MKNNFCLPIIEKSQPKILHSIRTNLSEYRYFEIWIDYIDDLDTDFLMRMTRTFPGRILFVFRRLEGRAIKMNLKDRIRVIDVLSQTNSFIDLDIRKQEKEIKMMRGKKIKAQIILSHHDYGKTPSLRTLNALTVKNDDCILKIATKCNFDKDSATLLSLLLKLKKEGRKCIIIGMGSQGAITRVLGALWGNEMTFAPSSTSKKTAPGQLTRKHLEKIISLLKK